MGVLFKSKLRVHSMSMCSRRSWRAINMKVVFILSCLVASSLTQDATEETSTDVSTAPSTDGLDEGGSTPVIVSDLTSNPGGVDGSSGITPRQKKCRKRPRTKPKAPSCRKPNRPKGPPSGTICFSVKEAMQNTIESVTASLSPSLLGNGTGGEAEIRKIDLSTIRDQLEPLITTLQAQIQAIKNAPEGSDNSGVLGQVLIVLEDLLKSLFSDGPIEIGSFSSNLLESVMLLIGYDVIGQQGGDGRSNILSNILSSVVPPILSLLGALGDSSSGLLKTLSASVETLVNSGLQGLLGGGRQPSKPAPKPKQTQSNNPGLIGGLLGALLG